MKNIFVKTALAAAVLCAPTAYAQESSGSEYTVMKWGGGIAAIAGTAFFISQKQEADNCRDINSKYVAPRTVRIGNNFITTPGSIRCTNQQDLDDKVALAAGVAVLGAAFLIGGVYLDSQAVPFQIRAKPDGSIALERDGLSLATRGDKFSLSKRWTF